MRRRIAIIIATNLGIAFAQAPDFGGKEKGERMSQLNFLIGKWQGAGYYEFAPGQRAEFESTEDVSPAAGGTVLVIRGTHRAGGQVVHDAIGLVTWDVKGQKYTMHAAIATGAQQTFTFNLVQNVRGYSWSAPGPGGLVNYTMVLDDRDRWKEIGEIGGKKIFEMNLKRVESNGSGD